MKQDSRDLVDDPILILLHRPHFPELPLLRISRYCYRRPVLLYCSYHPPAPSLCYPVPVVKHGKHHKFSIALETLACMLASQQDGVSRTAQKTLLSTSDYAWF